MKRSSTAGSWPGCASCQSCPCNSTTESLVATGACVRCQQTDLRLSKILAQSEGLLGRRGAGWYRIAGRMKQIRCWKNHHHEHNSCWFIQIAPSQAKPSQAKPSQVPMGMCIKLRSPTELAHHVPERADQLWAHVRDAGGRSTGDCW